MEPLGLHNAGTNVFRAFEGLLSLYNSNQFTSHHLTSEAQRFRLWAHSLGLHQQGHASLDYRVRDAVVVRDRLAEILLELQEHLENLLAIARGKRLPYELDVAADVDENDDDDISSVVSDAESHDSKQSHPDSDGPVHEVDFRLQSLTESLDALYSLATKIRNPRNRPQRTNDQLYKRIPAEVRASFIQEREEAEIAIIAWTQHHQLIEESNPYKDNDEWKDEDRWEDEDQDKWEGEVIYLELTLEELIDRYAARSNWLVRRTGIANARRKQQFVYWKDHAIRLSQEPVPSKQTIPVAERSIEEKPIAVPQSRLAPRVATEQAALAIESSLATSATKLEADFVKLGDGKSVISHQSHVSTVMDRRGKKLEWPAPPTQITSNGYFVCPYCKILCPGHYLAKNAWQVHLIHDLQPYHCTYEECLDPHRLYGTRQEWIDHESQHSRVWHCQMHGKEFETQLEYVEHLKVSHPEATPEQFSPELVATVVGPSLKPHRDCPFCPTAFSDTIEMQKHITFHLERFALLALPPLVEDGSNEDSSGRPSDSNEVQHHGRQGSILGDFDHVDELLFREICGYTTRNVYDESLILNKKELSLVPSFVDNCASTVLAWLETSSESSDAAPNIDHALDLPMPFPGKTTTFADLTEVTTPTPNAVASTRSSRELPPTLWDRGDTELSGISGIATRVAQTEAAVHYSPPSTPPLHGRETSAQRPFSFENVFRRHQDDADMPQQQTEAEARNATEKRGERLFDEPSTAEDGGAASMAFGDTGQHPHVESILDWASVAKSTPPLRPKGVGLPTTSPLGHLQDTLQRLHAEAQAMNTEQLQRARPKEDEVDEWDSLQGDLDRQDMSENDTNDDSSILTRSYIQPNDPNSRTETPSESISRVSPLVTDVGNRRKLAKGLMSISNHLDTASQDRSDGGALDFPEIPGKDLRSPDPAYIPELYNQRDMAPRTVLGPRMPESQPAQSAPSLELPDHTRKLPGFRNALKRLFQ